MKRKNRNVRWIIVGTACVGLLCLTVFTLLGVHMSSQNEKTMNSVGGLYMKSMNWQISRHFSTMVGLRMDQLGLMVENVPGEVNQDSQ